MKLSLAILLASCSLASASTYYVSSSSGNDANPGTKISPWQRAPFMGGFSGTYVHVAGDHIILKGGEIWTAQANCLWQWPGSGSFATPDYIGVDLTWFTGGSFTLPTIDGQWANFNGTTDANHGYNAMFRPLGVNLTLDNIHFTRLYWNSSQTYQQVDYILENSTGNNTNFIVSNCVFDNWQHGPSATTGVLECIIGAQGAGSKDFGNMVSNCVFNGFSPANSTDFQSTGNGLYLYGGKVVNCRFLNMCNSMTIANDGTTSWCEITDCEIGPIWNSWSGGTEHDNGLRIPQGAGIIPLKRVYIHDTSSAQAFWGDSGETEILINCIFTNPRQSPSFFLDPLSASGGRTLLYNTTVSSAGQPLSQVPGRGGAHSYGAFSIIDSHIIGASTLTNYTSTALNAFTNISNTIQSTAVANVQGYTGGNKYAPTSINGATFGAGFDISSIIPAASQDYLLVSRPQSGRWDTGAYEYLSASPGTIAFLSNAQQISQNAGNVIVSVSRTVGTTGISTVDIVTRDGSAIAGHDYTFTSNRVVYADGATGVRSVSIPILPSGDTALTNRNFTVYLTNIVNSSLGTPNTNQITILMNPPPMTYAQTVTSITPNSGVAIVASSDINGFDNGSTTFSRTYTVGSSVMFTALATASGNSFVKWQKDGVDYTNGVSASLVVDNPHTWTAIYLAPPPPTVFQLTVSSAPLGEPITISPADNNGASNGTTPFSRAYTSNTVVTLTAPSSGFYKWQLDGSDYTFGPSTNLIMNAAHTMSAIYNPTNAGTISFTPSTVYNTCETCGTVTLFVSRTGATNIDTTVSFASVDGSAVSGVDFNAVGGTLHWGVGVNSQLPITITILNAGAFGPSKFFRVLLSNPTNGATISTPQAVISIAQNSSISVPIGIVLKNLTLTGIVTLQGR